MAGNHSGPRKPSSQLDGKKLDDIVAKARKERDTRMAGYREQSLRLHPWVCGRCGRTFTRENLHELTVHHKDHNHDNNPSDGSNWENLCLHARFDLIKNTCKMHTMDSKNTQKGSIACRPHGKSSFRKPD